MKISLGQKFQYDLKRRIVLGIKKHMDLFARTDIEQTLERYKRVKLSAKRAAVFDEQVELFARPISSLMYFSMIIFFGFMHFYLSYYFALDNPLKTAFIYIIPSLILSLIIYLSVIYGSLARFHFETILPLSDEISNILRWVLISAIISTTSALLFSKLITYLFLTPIIIGVGVAIISLIYEISIRYSMNYFRNTFQKKYPISAIIDMLIETLTRFDEDLISGYYYRMYVAQILGETSETMQKTLLRFFTRFDRHIVVSEISDPYIIKLLENRVAEMAMTLRVYAKMLLLGNEETVKFVREKVRYNLTAILDNNWQSYEIEKSDEVSMLVTMKPLSTKFEVFIGKLKFAFIGFLPAIVLFILQNSDYALSEKIFESILPFVITWTFVSILNLLGSDDAVDKFLRAKNVAESLKVY